MPLYEVHGIEQPAGVETIVPIEALSTEDALRHAGVIGLGSARVVEPRRCDALDDPNYMSPAQRGGRIASSRQRWRALAAGAMLIVFVAVAATSSAVAPAKAGSALMMVSAIILIVLSLGFRASNTMAR